MGPWGLGEGNIRQCSQGGARGWRYLLPLCSATLLVQDHPPHDAGDGWLEQGCCQCVAQGGGGYWDEDIVAEERRGSASPFPRAYDVLTYYIGVAAAVGWGGCWCVR